jgi:hypothetical protein
MNFGITVVGDGGLCFQAAHKMFGVAVAGVCHGEIIDHEAEGDMMSFMTSEVGCACKVRIRRYQDA